MARQFPMLGAGTSGRYAADFGYMSGATPPRVLGPSRASQIVRDLTVHLLRLFGDAQCSTDVSKRLAFTQCDFSFTQFTDDLFDGVTKTWHAGLLSARS